MMIDTFIRNNTSGKGQKNCVMDNWTFGMTSSTANFKEELLTKL